MGKPLNYPDTLEFYEVKSSGYRGTKEVVEFADVPCIFIQGTGLQSQNSQDNIDADAICYPKIDHEFITERANRLEGIYVHAILFDGESAKSWYKIESVVVNRDHLLNNEIDNIECRLKKTSPLPQVS